VFLTGISDIIFYA